MSETKRVTLDLTLAPYGDEGHVCVLLGGMYVGEIDRDPEWVRGWDWADGCEPECATPAAMNVIECALDDIVRDDDLAAEAAAPVSS